MDSGSDGHCLEDIQMCSNNNVENTKESVEEDASWIFSPELRDIFPMFISMLDAKSFMKFAMTSKDVYKRCMEDKGIKINVYENEFIAEKINDSGLFRWLYPDTGYVAALRTMPCNFFIRSLEMGGSIETSSMTAFNGYMKEFGTYRIDELTINYECEEWETIKAFIRDFRVKSLKIYYPQVGIDVLRSLLQLNLDKFYYRGTVNADFVLEMESSIPEISFLGITDISKEELTYIMSKLQSGPIHRLIVDNDAVNWDEFDLLPLDHEGPLPTHRPLIFTVTTPAHDHLHNNTLREYWFLHSNGAVTKCTTETSFDLQILKCEPRDYPWILRKEEDVLKDLTEKHPRVSCSTKQFHTFVNGFAILDPSQKWPLPAVRPLCYKISENDFWLLDEKDSFMNCTWKSGSATWEPFDSEYSRHFDHPALAMHIFWKLIKETDGVKNCGFYCQGLRDFDRWFDGFDKLSFEYSGPLPSTRPLIFERNKTKIMRDRVVLLEDRLLECVFWSKRVEIKRCRYLNRPPCLFTAETVVEVLKDQDPTNRHFGMRVRDMPWEKTANEFWFVFDRVIRKIDWKRGRFNLFDENDIQKTSLDFKKRVFKHFAETEPKSGSGGFFLTLEEFHSCLEQFTIVPFEYSGPLTSDPPLAFVKNEIRHTCRKGAARRVHCDCTDSSILVWFLCNGMGVAYCSTVTDGVIFQKVSETTGVPPALKSKKYLKNLLQGKYDKFPSVDWYGGFEDFLACLNEFIKLPFEYDGPLPEVRPLAFDSQSDEGTPAYFILRGDETVIKCMKYASHISIFLSTNKESFPPALKSLL